MYAPITYFILSTKVALVWSVDVYNVVRHIANGLLFVLSQIVQRGLVIEDGGYQKIKIRVRPFLRRCRVHTRMTYSIFSKNDPVVFSVDVYNVVRHITEIDHRSCNPRRGFTIGVKGYQKLKIWVRPRLRRCRVHRRVTYSIFSKNAPVVLPVDVYNVVRQPSTTQISITSG